MSLRQPTAVWLTLFLLAASTPGAAFETQDVLEKLRAGNFEAVEAYYAALQAQHGLNQDGLRPLSVAYGQFPIRQDLLPLLDAWCEKYPDSPFAFTQRGVFYLGYAWEARGTGRGSSVTEADAALFKDRIRKAQADLEQAYVLEPNLPHAAAYLITVARALGWNRNAMEEQFQRAIRANPTYYGAYRNKLQYLTRKWGGSDREMFQFAEEAVAHAPEGSLVPMVLVEAHYEKFYEPVANPDYFRAPQVWQSLEQTFAHLLRAFPLSDSIRCLFGVTATHAGRYELANQQFEQIKNGSFLAQTEWFSEIRAAYHKLNRQTDLERLLSEWVAIDPDNPRALFQLGLLTKELHGPAQARPYFERAASAGQALIASNPGNKEIYFLMGGIYFEIALGRSVHYYQRYVQLAPLDPKGYGVLGSVYKEQGKHQEAKDTIEQGLRLDPMITALHEDLGDVLRAQGDLKGAFKAYEAALRLDPNDFNVHNSLAIVYDTQGKLEKAREHLAQAIRINPGYAQGYANLALMMERLENNYDAQLRYAKEAIRLDPRLAQGYLEAGRACQALGRMDEAFVYYRRYMELDPDGEAAVWLRKKFPELRSSNP